MTAAPLRCDVILVSWNKLEYTKACLESFLQCTRAEEVDYRLLIIDNGSDREVVEYLTDFQQRHPRVELLINAENRGLVSAVNQGTRRSTAPFICWLNNDLLFTEGWLVAMLRVAEAHPRIGLFNPSGKLHHETPKTFAQRIVRQPRDGGAPYREVSECNGACLLVRREVIDRIGLLDEAYASGGMDDSDYSRRAAQAGFLCVQVNEAFVYHWENVSVNSIEGYWQRERPQKRKMFEARWGPPRRIAVVCDEPEAPESCAVGRIETLVGLARLGIRIQLFVLGGGHEAMRQAQRAWRQAGTDHANFKVRWLSLWPGIPRWLGRWMARLRCVVILTSHRGKDEAKRFKGLIVLSSHGWRFMEAMRWLHGIPISRSLEACPLVTRELGWYRKLASRSAP